MVLLDKDTRLSRHLLRKAFRNLCQNSLFPFHSSFLYWQHPSTPIHWTRLVFYHLLFFSTIKIYAEMMFPNHLPNHKRRQENASLMQTPWATFWAESYTLIIHNDWKAQGKWQAENVTCMQLNFATVCPESFNTKQGLGWAQRITLHLSNAWWKHCQISPQIHF